MACFRGKALILFDLDSAFPQSSRSHLLAGLSRVAPGSHRYIGQLNSESSLSSVCATKGRQVGGQRGRRAGGECAGHYALRSAPVQPQGTSTQLSPVDREALVRAFVDDTFWSRKCQRSVGGDQVPQGKPLWWEPVPIHAQARGPIAGLRHGTGGGGGAALYR